MKSRLWVAASSLAIAGLVILACAPAATLPPTPKPSVSIPTPGATVVVPGPTPQGVTRAAAPTPTERPQYGGTLNTIIHTDTLDRDLHQSRTVVSLLQLAGVYSTLIKMDPADPMKLIPDLAEKWEIGSDAKTYTFHLRRGVKFSDGTPLTAADVKANFDRIIWPPKGIVSMRKDLFLGVEKVAAPDDYTVVFSLKQPQFAFLDSVASPWNVIFPKSILQAKGHMKADILGSGPFLFKEYTSGVSTKIVRNPGYFVPERPYLDGITVYIIKDTPAVVAAFKTGQLDLVYAGNGQLFGTERQSILRVLPDTVVQVVPDTLHLYFMPNHKYKPWNDARVRKAVHLALDRQAYIDIAMRGDGFIGSHMLPGFWSLPKEEVLKLPGYRYPKDPDIAEAKRLLVDAGYPQGFKTRVMTSSTLKAFADSAVLAKDQLSKIGIDVTIELYDTAKILQERFERRFEVLMFGFTPGTLEPEGVLGPEYHSKGSGNFGSYSNPRFDELFQKASQTMDPVERQKLTRELDRLLYEDQPRAVVYWRLISSVARPWVKGFIQGPDMAMGPIDFRDVWMAK